MSDGKYPARAWLCQCDCGTQVRIRGKHLTRNKNNVISCGCYKREPINNPKYRHGGKHTPEYRAWQEMKRRCDNADRPSYEDYGGRGIAYCKRWRDFAKFIEDMGPKPSGKHSLDRIENNKGYCKSNCRWATSKVQHRNRRNTIQFTLKGVTRPLIEWCEHFGLPYRAIYMRLKGGFPADLLFSPVESGKHVRR